MEKEIEVPVVLKLTPAARDALWRSAEVSGLSVDEKVSVIVEVNFVDRDYIAGFQKSLEDAGISGQEFSDAWREGQEELRSPTPERGGKSD